MTDENTFTGIRMFVILVAAVRGFLQVFRPTIRAGRIRVTSLTGNEFWMPLWWRPFAVTTSIIAAVVEIAFLAVLFRS